MKRVFLILSVMLCAGILSAQAALVSGGKNSIEVLYSNAEETVLQYKIGDFERRAIEIEGKSWYHIALPKEGHSQERGMPELPVLNRSIIIDNNAHIRLEVYDIEYTDLRLPVAPSKGIIYRDTNPDTVPYTFDAIYQESSFYPSEIATLSEPYILRDFRGITIKTNPFAYRGDTQSLRVYSAYKIRVFNSGTDTINILPARRSEISRAFSPLYENHFLNWQSQRYTSVNDSFGKLLVVCHSSFMAAIEPWVNWKRQKGIETEVVNWSTIGSTANQLKTYIQNKYNADSNLAFVQIVGDAPQIPSLSSGGGGSDPSFALVAGNDNYPDIFIGRFSAQTVSELNVQLNRSIAYERDLNTSDSWLSRGMGIASNEGGSGGDNGETDIQHMNIIRNKLLNFGYTTVDQLHQPNATAAMVTTNINAGRGIVNYVGHGADSYWVTTGFSNSNATALTNGNKAPFIVSVACVNGNFVSQTCFAEAWLRAPNGGAITMYASSINQSWASPMRAQDEICDLWVANAKSTAGGYYFNGSCKMIDVYGTDGVNMFKTWNIFGDASLMVRSKTPQAMTVSHPAQMNTGASTLSVSTGVANALVALSYNNQIYARGYTNSSGLLSLPLANLPTGNITYTLTVTAYNRVSYIGQLQQSLNNQPYLIATLEYVDNNNNLPEYGESGRFKLSVQNVGTLAAGGVTATLSSQNTYITFTDATENVGLIQAGATVVRNNAFSFEIANNTPFGSEALFDITLSSGTNSWEDTYALIINSPRLEYGALQIIDNAGNNNGALDPGETATLRIPLSNTGTAASPAGTATLSCMQTGISIAAPSISVNALGINGSQYLQWEIQVAESIAQGTLAEFLFNVNAGAYTVSHSAEEEIGAPDIISIGNGTSTQIYPLNRYYNYSAHEAIYLASELQGAGSIKALAYYKGSGANTEPIEQVSIYLKHTAANSLSSGTYSTTGYSLVYSGSFSNDATSGWMEIELDSRFAFNGTENLSILVLKGSQAWVSNYPVWRYSSTGSTYRARQAQSDSGVPSSLSASQNLPNIRFKVYSTPVNAALVSINPQQIDESLNSNSSLQKSLTLSNSGNMPLSWTAAVNNAWLDLSPASGTLGAGHSQTLSLSIDSGGLNAGTHSGSISFSSNAINNPNLNLPVNINVIAVPASPRFVAEWEPAQAAVVRYPFGQPASLLKNLSEDALLYVITTAGSQSAAHNTLNSAGANMANVHYINANTDSYWTRDYAPWTIFESGNQMKLIDFTYNRPRPNDNLIPGVIANQYNCGIYHIGLNHTGGNIMTDGMGKAMSTDLVLRENSSLSSSQINQRFWDFLGVSEYQIYSDPLTTGTIDHIDCWAKLLDVDKVMIIRVPPGHVNYTAIESSVAEWQAAISSYGTPYRIYRVDAPSNEPYANTFMMNNNIYVPIMGTANDAAALQAYQSAMPGYNVRGYSHGNYISDDALHCRVNTIFDSQMIAIRHLPSNELSSFTEYELSIQIDHTNALDALHSFVAYSYSAEGPWQQAALIPVAGNQYRALLSTAHLGSELYYYIQAQDITGRLTKLPLCGALDPFAAEVNSLNPAYPAWTLVAYPNAPAKLYLEVDFFGEAPAAGDLVAAFVNSECRGISRYSSEAGGLIALTVQLAAANESVSFVFYRLAEAESYVATESITLSFGQNLPPANAQLISFNLAEPQLSLSFCQGSLHLYWEPVPYAQSYNIYRALSPEGEYSLWQNVSGNSLSFSPLEDRRFYRIRAVK